MKVKHNKKWNCYTFGHETKDNYFVVVSKFWTLKQCLEFYKKEHTWHLNIQGLDFNLKRNVSSSCYKARIVMPLSTFPKTKGG